MTVKGEKPHHVMETSVEYVVEEFSTDSFERQFKLAEDVSTDEIEAKCENGVLHISFYDEKPKTYKRAHNIEVG